MNSSGTDRISDLPDSVIGQILSCLPAKDAVGTTILSKRWKNLVAFAVRLDIDGYTLYPDYDWSSYLFVDFVDKLLINRILSLDTLILKFSGGRGGGNDSKVISWICAALRLKVKCLTLDFNLSDLSSLFSSLYGCKTLSSLELTLPTIRYRGYDEVKHGLCLPDDFNLPNLKSLKFHNVDLSAPKTTGLIDGCPVPEELCVQRCFLVSWGTLYVGTIHIRSHLLKRLDVQDCDGKLCLQLDLPNLRVLSYNNYDISVQVVSSLKFLDSAHIGSSILDATGLAKLTIACSSATRLYLTSNAIEALHRMSVDLSTYQNLMWLQLHGQSGWEILLRLLCSAPNLKKVVFEKGCTKGREGFADFECLFSKQPICLGLHVNEIHFPEFSGDDSDFELIEFFLKNAKVLMKLKLHCVSINNSCVLDRLCRLSTKPIVFITFSCWKDEELLKRSRSSLESNASLAMMNQSMSELQESKRQLMNIRHLSKSDLLESKKHLIKMNQKMIENLSTLMQQWRNST